MSGTKKPRPDAGRKRKAQEGSMNWKLAQLEVGQHLWLDADPSMPWRQFLQGIVKPDSRRPIDTVGKGFSTRVYRALPSQIDGEVVILVKVTRDW